MSRDFRLLHIVGQKTSPWAFWNRQEWFRKISFSRWYSLTTLTPCQWSRWLRGHPVNYFTNDKNLILIPCRKFHGRAVVDYMQTRCQRSCCRLCEYVCIHSRWLCEHDVSVVIDFTDTVSVQHWLCEHLNFELFNRISSRKQKSSQNYFSLFTRS